MGTQPVFALDQSIGDCGSLSSWAAGLVEEFYSETNAGQLAFLDLEDHRLVSAAIRAGVNLREIDAKNECSAAEDALITVTRAFLNLDPAAPGRTSIRRFYNLASNWMISRRGSDWQPGERLPLWLPWLAVMVRAAEKMRAGEGMAANNYYGRLSAMFGLQHPTDRRIEYGVREDSEALWHALNIWLEDFDGKRGYPTATVRGQHRFVGLPLSQSLLRDADRAKVFEFFESAGLSPGGTLGSSEAEGLLEAWLHDGAFSPHAGLTNLKAIWTKKQLRPVLAEIVCTLYVSWGTVLAAAIGDSGHASKKLRLVLWQRKLSPFTPVRVEGAFAVRPWFQEAELRGLHLQGNQDDEVEFGLVKHDDNWAVVKCGASLDLGSMLAQEFRLRSQDDENVQLVHVPRAIVPLEFCPELTGGFVQVEKLAFGKRYWILVHDSVNQRLEHPGGVNGLLDAISQPNYRVVRAEDIDGLPHDWTLFCDVVPSSPLIDDGEGLFAPRDRQELDPLFPVFATSIQIASGLRLPGQRSCWLASAGITLIATTQASRNLRIDVRRISSELDGGDPVLATGQCGDGSATLELVPTDLCVGRYRAVAIDTSQDLELCQLTFDLVGGQDAGATEGNLADANQNQWCELETLPSAIAIVGQKLQIAPIAFSAAVPQSHSEWSSLSREIVRLKFGDSSRSSCAITGSHRTEVETAGRWQRQTCRQCGREFKSPTKPKNRHDGRPERAGKIVLAKPLELGNRSVNVSSLVDAMSWMRSGTQDQLEVLLGQFEDGALNLFETTARLDNLAIIDRKITQSGVATSWWANPPSLYELPGGSAWQVTGTVSTKVRSMLQQRALESGLEYRVRVEGLRGNDLIVGDVAVLSPDTLSLHVFKESRWQAMLWCQLPSLGALLSRLETVEIDEIAIRQKFDIQSARWVEDRGKLTPGAFRLTQGLSGAKYFFASAEMLGARRWVRVGAALAKHLAAAGVGQPLLTFNQSDRRLLVPRGALLPGLYGRLLTLQTGTFPVPVEKPFAYAYEGVSADTAARLAHLMGRI